MSDVIGLDVSDRVVAEQMLTTAKRLHSAGQVATAEPLYRKIVEIVPDNAEARHLLGVALLQTGRADEAIELLESALAMEPRNAILRNRLGVAYAGDRPNRQRDGALSGGLGM